MNQKDALLAGAKRCLVTKGYGRTTARDIAEASGAHLGSIGYHYGSKDRLLNLAALELSSEWGDSVERLVLEAEGATPLERLSATLAATLSTLPENRETQSASLQAMVQAQFDEGLRKDLASGSSTASRELAALLAGRDKRDSEDLSAAEAGVGFLARSLMTGIVAHFLIDAEDVPDADQLRSALALLASESSADPGEDPSARPDADPTG